MMISDNILQLQATLNDPDLGHWVSERRLVVEEKTSSMCESAISIRDHTDQAHSTPTTVTNYKGDLLGKFTPSQRWIPTALDPFPYCKVKAQDIQTLLGKWRKLESYDDFRDRFLNMHSLHTNHIEGTFLLNEVVSGCSFRPSLTHPEYRIPTKSRNSDSMTRR